MHWIGWVTAHDGSWLGPGSWLPSGLAWLSFLTPSGSISSSILNVFIAPFFRQYVLAQTITRFGPALSATLVLGLLALFRPPHFPSGDADCALRCIDARNDPPLYGPSHPRHTQLTLQHLSTPAGSGVIDLTAEDDAQDAAATGAVSSLTAAPVSQREQLRARLQREYMVDGQQPQTDDRDHETGLDMEEF